MQLKKQNGIWKFVSMETGFEPVERESFKLAWKDMFDYVQKLLAEGVMSMQMLETGMWIDAPTKGCPIFFYDARDIACDAKWLVDGKSTI